MSESEEKLPGEIKIKRHIEILPIAQPPVMYSIFVDGSETDVAGYALITAKAEKKKLTFGVYKTACLWHIYVSKEHRLKGCGRSLIHAIKKHFDEIYTQVLTDDGGALMQKCGFEPETRGGSDFIVWRK